MSSNERAGGNRPHRNTFGASTTVAGHRAWRREVDSADEDELMLIVRSFAAVDRAVSGYRGRR
jgi:hypothetical protein